MKNFHPHNAHHTENIFIKVAQQNVPGAMNPIARAHYLVYPSTKPISVSHPCCLHMAQLIINVTYLLLFCAHSVSDL